MPVFEPGDHDRRDLRLLENGCVHRYWRPEVLAAEVDALLALGWAVVEMDASGWGDPAVIHEAWAAALAFPEYYGRNLAALDDCLSDVVQRAYGFPPDVEGLALVLDRFDGFVLDDAGAAAAVLEIIDVQARHGLLFGNRMMALVRTDDATLELPALRGRAVGWNPAEWLISRHDPDHP